MPRYGHATIPRHLRDIVLGVVRDGMLYRVDAPEVDAVEEALIGAGFALVFFYVPNEADQGFIQKIFYLHVPLAIVALVGARRDIGNSAASSGAEPVLAGQP